MLFHIHSYIAVLTSLLYEENPTDSIFSNIDCRDKLLVWVFIYFIDSYLSITIWIDIHLGIIHPEDCFLSQTESSSAAGWLRKSNCAEDQDEEIQLSTARKLATLLIDSQCCIYSQWFSGETYITFQTPFLGIFISLILPSCCIICCFPHSGTLWIGNSSTPIWGILLGDLSAALVSTNNAVV